MNDSTHHAADDESGHADEPGSDETEIPEASAEAGSVPRGPGGEGADAEGRADGYLVHLDQFEGPLDLLLYLIQRDEIDVYDIPIAHITKQYLESMERLDVFNLDNAGEFLVMAATLMRIKARMLLPVTRIGEDEDDDVDPRDELVRRLLEYKKYKEASQELAKKEEERADFFGRGSEFPFLSEAEEEPPELSLSLIDLLRAVRSVLEEMRNDSVHQVYTEVYTVDGQEELILRRLEDESRLRFEELFRGMNVKMEVVVTFVALLDLLKNRRIRAYQAGSYGAIWLEAREPEAEAEAQSGTDDLLDEEVDESAADPAPTALAQSAQAGESATDEVDDNEDRGESDAS